MTSAQHSLRRRQNRRQQERRNLNLEFNSPEWIEYMNSHFLLWPKADRRQIDRRSCDRRTNERRSPRRSLVKPLSNPSLNISDILSDEEKQLIQQLFAEESIKNQSV